MISCKNNSDGNRDSEDQLFRIPRHIAMARERDGVYEEYSRHSQEM